MRELLKDLLKFLQEDQYELAALKKKIDKMTNSELLDEINSKFKPYKLDVNVLEPFSEEEDDIYDAARKMRDDHKNPYNGAKDSTIVDNKDVSFSHPEDHCQNCGCKNPTWFAPNELFNKVNGSPNGIICPSCFEKIADQMGIDVIFEARRIGDYDWSKVLDSIKNKPQPKQDKEISDLKELLTNIDKSLYLGEGLKDEEILNWYMEVVKTIKDEIREQIK